jgi:hypothetical protein
MQRAAALLGLLRLTSAAWPPAVGAPAADVSLALCPGVLSSFAPVTGAVSRAPGADATPLVVDIFISTDGALWSAFEAALARNDSAAAAPSAEPGYPLTLAWRWAARAALAPGANASFSVDAWAVATDAFASYAAAYVARADAAPPAPPSLDAAAAAAGAGAVLTRLAMAPTAACLALPPPLPAADVDEALALLPTVSRAPAAATPLAPGGGGALGVSGGSRAGAAAAVAAAALLAAAAALVGV